MQTKRENIDVFPKIQLFFLIKNEKQICLFPFLAHSSSLHSIPSTFIKSQLGNHEVKQCVIGPNHVAFLLDVGICTKCLCDS